MYRFVEHKADLAILIEAESKEKLFKSALEAVKELLTGGSEEVVNSQAVTVRVIKGKGYDDEERLIELMNEFLFVCQVEKCFPLRIKDLRFGQPDSVSAELEILSGDHGLQFEREIKAATYHDLNIESGNGWRVKVVLDV